MVREKRANRSGSLLNKSRIWIDSSCRRWAARASHAGRRVNGGCPRWSERDADVDIGKARLLSLCPSTFRSPTPISLYGSLLLHAEIHFLYVFVGFQFRGGAFQHDTAGFQDE